MSDWQPDLYLAFRKERTQPAIDLVAKIDYHAPDRIIDIGSGPGTSTAVLKARWPEAEIMGVDKSEAMIEQAIALFPNMNWQYADASEDLSSLGGFDIVFSNAVIQWIPDNEALVHRLFGMLNPGGVLAVQVPRVTDMPIYSCLMDLVSGEKWSETFAGFTEVYSRQPVEFYYDVLSPLTQDLDMWETRYFHVMNTHADIVAWYSSTGLRNYLNYLGAGEKREEFLRDYEELLTSAYEPQRDGKILFPYTRVFFIAKNSAIVQPAFTSEQTPGLA